jgi:type II secretory pathway pseudopilin PulG
MNAESAAVGHRERTPLSSAGAAQSARASRGAVRRAFSLVELMIAVGLIVLLVALVFAVGTMLLSQSEARQTRSALELMDTAVGEWEASTGRSFTYGTNGQPAPSIGQPIPRYDFQESVTDANMIVEVLKPDFLGGSEAAKTILAKIDPTLLRTRPSTNPPLTELLDAWGTPIVVVFPGREFTSGDAGADRDVDGTFRTPQEKRLGICRNRKLLLVSAGPDGLLGQLNGTSAQRTQAEDNLYSYEPLKP